jgi:DNA-binding NarL/FixJ family response regulator
MIDGALNILLVDDHALFRAGLRILLRQQAPEARIVEAATIPEALLELEAAAAMHLCLLDLSLGENSGLEVLTTLREAAPDTAIIIVSGTTDPAMIHRCLAEGAMSFVPKTMPPQTLAAALRQVLRGESYLPEEVLTGRAAAAADTASLTARQRDVLCGLMLGLAAKSIAQRLDLSVHTVNEHLERIYRVLAVHSRAEAVMAATAQGIRFPRETTARMMGR